MPHPPVITSAANPVAKRVRALANRRTRRAESAYVVDGVQPVWRALGSGTRIETLLTVVAAPGSPVSRLVEQAENAGVPITWLSAELMQRLSGRAAPSGVMAIVRGQVAALDSIRPATDAVIVGLHRVANPGNLGTVIRTADAVGADGVVTIGPSADPLSPAAVKASMGGLYGVAVAHAETLDEFFAWTSARGLRLLTTSPRAPTSHWDADWTPPLALLLGSEGEGLPADAAGRGDPQVRIPMTGAASSLNLAVSAGVLLVEARRAALAQAAVGQTAGLAELSRLTTPT